MSEKIELCRDCGKRTVEPGLDFGLVVWTDPTGKPGGLQNFGRRMPIPLCMPCAEKRATVWWTLIKQDAAEGGLLG